jgi:hypothetical protein
MTIAEEIKQCKEIRALVNGDSDEDMDYVLYWTLKIEELNKLL